MKQIMAIVRPEVVEKVEHALQQLPHFPGFTLIRVKGESRGRAPGHAYAPDEADIEEHENTMVLVLCADDGAPRIVKTIREASRTGRPGDGVIAVSEVAQILRIGSDERDDDAT